MSDEQEVDGQAREAVRTEENIGPVEERAAPIRGTDFEAWLFLEAKPRLRQTLPTIDAVVTGDPVASVVAENWEETFRRRVADLPQVVDGRAEAPTVTRDRETLLVETVMTAAPPSVPSVAIATTNYVEGTWIEGIIPGYEYNAQVQAIRERARATGGE